MPDNSHDLNEQREFQTRNVDLEAHGTLTQWLKVELKPRGQKCITSGIQHIGGCAPHLGEEDAQTAPLMAKTFRVPIIPNDRVIPLYH
jgi:hypothetical protein